MNLKELSEVLGLSPTTVSRALNGYPEVSESTRARVRKVAEQQNYRPNMRAMGLATGRAMAIGHIISVDTRNEVVNPIFAEFIAGASQTYSRHGYELILVVAESDNEEATYRGLAAKGAVDGVIVHAPRCDDSRIELLQQIGLPFVTHGRVTNCDVEYSWIDINNRRAFKQATQLLVDLGHNRIALINGRETLSFAWRRREGYLEALFDASIDIDEAIMAESELTENHGYTSAKSMLQMVNAPTAFLVSSYVVALGVRRAITEEGLHMGPDVSVIIHDDELSFFNNDGEVPQFTATRSSVRAAGASAAQMLLDIVADPSCAPITQLLEAHLTIGRSTGPFRGKLLHDP